MRDINAPLWQYCSARPIRICGSDLDNSISRALASTPMTIHRARLERVGRHIDPEPLLCKNVEEPFLRLFFAVEGGSDEITRGTIVALVLLYDTKKRQTLYAHPVFAGPEANSMMKNLYGPMAAPKAQAGINGDRATLRFLEHKRVLWKRFEEETSTIGRAAASRRWNESFHWALVRLYFCDRCDGCRWGNPHFDGVEGEPFHTETKSPTSRLPSSFELHAFVDAVIVSEQWKLEIAYVKRGGFVVSEKPRILHHLDQRFAVAIFPTTEEFIEAGSVVGVLVYFDMSMDRVTYVHSLTAGREPDPQLLFGDRELGLPALTPAAGLESARQTYIAWRKSAWTSFWLDELEMGIHEASERWREGFWEAMQSLLSSQASLPKGQSDTTDLSRTSAMSS